MDEVERTISTEDAKSTEVEVDIKFSKDKFNALKQEIAKSVVGQHDVIEKILINLFTDQHALLEGVPGLAKSLLVETLSRGIRGTVFKRIQFVPDMLPSDLIGVRAYNQKTGEFYISKGPIFANFILADEINRAPPKTQAAMLESMQERKVTIHTQDFELPSVYFVIATQNPLEQHGTYPLPEALIDRFFMKIIFDYPKRGEELEIINRNSIVNPAFEEIMPVVSEKDIETIRDYVKRVYLSEEVKDYIMDLVYATRGSHPQIEKTKYVRYGGSPRASIFLGLGGRAYALFQGRDYVIPDDIKKVAPDILRHRIILNYEGKALNLSTDDIISDILNTIEAP